MNGRHLRVRAGPLLRVFRAQRRGENNDNQMPVEFPATHFRANRARIRPGPAEGRSGSERAAGIRAGFRGVLPLDDGAVHAGLPRVVSQDMEPQDQKGICWDSFGWMKKKTNALSKGQKTQVALIGAVSAEPELLVLDEPTSGLDPIVRQEFIQAVIGAYRERSQDGAQCLSRRISSPNSRD